MKIELNKNEYKLIRKALESRYYLAKDEGDYEEMDLITKLEEKLIKNSK
ncbi:hypothetical protein [uncultured Metabacillus sp.]|nr:hypothetical protein [uncultured Metabacillus sp.]